MEAGDEIAIPTALYFPKVWQQSVDDVYSILKHRHLGSFFHFINNLHQTSTLLCRKKVWRNNVS